MVISEHAAQFGGKPVYDYEINVGLQAPESRVPRLRVDYDSEVEATDMLTELLQQPGADQLTGLIIGAWSGEMYDSPPTEIIEALVAGADQLPSLTALFLGDIIYEENEISWIHQTDVSPLWQAFPKLREFQVRGGNGLSLGSIQHDHLTRLVVETGGLPKSVMAEVAAARVPRLEHLELYLGTENYGWDGSLADVTPLLSGTLFPKLTYLGLRNSEMADEIAQAAANSPLLGRLHTLDLSLGTLTDAGAAALVDSPAVRQLKKLDLHRHYLSDEMQERVQAIGIEVDVSEQQTPDDEYRYVAIGE